jgi:hypothetical protein
MKNGLRERVQLVKTFQMSIKHSMFENFFFCAFSQWFLRFSPKLKGLMKNGLRERVRHRLVGRDFIVAGGAGSGVKSKME